MVFFVIQTRFFHKFSTFIFVRSECNTMISY